METTNMMKMFLALGGLTAQTMEEKVKYKERIIFATPGIIKPNNWEELSMEEKLRRLNKLETV
jgi:hypothetical protein|tara:strand:+ start:122 stop:310 length:189 start_codon:yes stop_codon:yes gene_type:complete